jgi:hypothetical protein
MLAGLPEPGTIKKRNLFIEALNQKGYAKTVLDQFNVDTDVLVYTRSVNAFISLADDLASPEGSRCSSLGMAIGTAERGKTHTARWYVENHQDACYVLFVEGSTRVQLLRDIREALAKVRPLTFGACLSLIRECCGRQPRLIIIIIDEADKLPVPFLELIRGINERCAVPMLIAGEEGLKSKADNVPRPRIRKPVGSPVRGGQHCRRGRLLRRCLRHRHRPPNRRDPGQTLLRRVAFPGQRCPRVSPHGPRFRHRHRYAGND